MQAKSELDVVHHAAVTPHYAEPEAGFTRRLGERRAAMLALAKSFDDRAEFWSARSFPVLGILAPAMTDHAENIEYPGDPMCLYSALSYAVSEACRARVEALGDNDPYNDLAPQLGYLPSLADRERAGGNTLRPLPEDPGRMTTDQAIFDPRVWNAEVEAYLRRFLRAMAPSVVVISSVSSGHRYALQMASVVKQEDPRTLVVFGGRHADETVRLDREGNLQLAYSATYRAVADGRASDAVDVVVAGESYYALDLLLKAIASAMDPADKRARPEDVLDSLNQHGRAATNVKGDAIFLVRTPGRVNVVAMRGGPFDLSTLPTPYDAFAIRARFPIFPRADGEAKLTAHVTTTSACPYQCNFCSEGAGVVGRMLKYRDRPVAAALDRIRTYVSYGAEALFFDDSVFFGGHVGRMIELCHALRDARESARAGGTTFAGAPLSPAERERLLNLEFGAQLTVEFVTSLRSREQVDELLSALRDAGCSYLYFGIESLAPSVAGKLHKNRGRTGSASWKEKTRQALERAKAWDIRVGVAVLFGLDGETRETIDYTIDGVAELVRDGLIAIASPSILTYHPGTEITRMHGMEDRLDYHTRDIEQRPPYTYFEQADSRVVSNCLSEDDIWYIHFTCQQKWGEARNETPMNETQIPA